MDRFPLYRSLLFWAGVVVMGFITWGWWHSTRAMSSTTYRGWMLMNADSRVSWGHFQPFEKQGWRVVATDPGDVTPSPWRFGFPKLVRTDEGGKGWDVPVLLSGTVEHPREMEMDFVYLAWSQKGDWQFFLPYWLLLTGFAMPWVGLLVWLRQRRRRAVKVMVEAQVAA